MAAIASCPAGTRLRWCAKAAISYLHHVAADGLDPTDYPTPDFASLSDPAALAEAELRLSMSIITYAHHAQVGRIHWSRVSADISFDDKPPEPADVRLTTDYDTATAIALGKENAQSALAQGRLRLGGDIDTLVRGAAALTALDDATAALRAATTYPAI